MSTTYTPNYHLGKQTDTADNFNMSVITNNMDIIDGTLAAKQNTVDNEHPIASNSISPMTGYEKSSSSTPGAINTSDTLNVAIGKVEKRVDLNQGNIDGQQNTITDGGNGYAIVNGIRLYVSSTAPTGDIPDGSVGVGW